MFGINTGQKVIEHRVMNTSIVRLDITLLSSFNLRVRVNATQMTLRKKKGSCECSFANCDVRFVGRRQAHSKLFQLIIFSPVDVKCCIFQKVLQITCDLTCKVMFFK